MVENSQTWQHRIGHQREIIWRGWQIRYSFLNALSSKANSKLPIFLIHGFGASVEHWRHNMSALNQNHSVYALDLLGFGASKKVKTTLARTNVNADSFQLMDRALLWIQNNSFKNPILKWKTEEWGEIPADFGRK